MPSDRYFGFRDTAELCEHVITTLFNVQPARKPATVGRQGIDTPPHSPVLAASTSKDEAIPNLGEFIAYALYRTRLPTAIIHQALLLLHRLKCRYPSARGTATSPHRLFLSSLMLSSKISMDDTYSNKSWQIVGQGLFDLREVNQMERELFAFLGWNVVVREEELSAWVDEVVKPYESNRDASSTAPERKRRREASVSQGSTSNSTRTPSPEDCRHRRASDAAALLLGRNNPKKERSSHGSSTSTPHSMRSASTSPSSQPPSSCSSHMCSPMSGLTTPGTPATPASTGPVTPDRAAEHLAPAWYCSTDAHAKDAVKVPSNLSHRADSNEVLC